MNAGRTRSSTSPHPAAAEVLDALDIQAVVLDSSGTITHANRAWHRFAEENGGRSDGYVGSDYLGACDAAAQDLIEAVLSRGHEGMLEYPCHAPHRARWFRMAARPLPSGGAVVTHTQITAEVTLRRLLTRTDLIVLRLGPDGTPMWCSDAWRRLRGAAGVGAGWLDASPAAQRELITTRLQRRTPFVVERLVTTDRHGGRRHLQMSFTPDTLEDGRSRGWQVVAVDVSSIHRMLELAQVATIDPLTEFVTRARLMEWLAATTSTVGLLYLDLDHFKQVNDQHGHRAGDQVLREAAMRIRSAVRPDDLCCRLGGDEFVVVLAHSAPDAVEQVANRIVSTFRRPFEVEAATAHLEVSIGMALRADEEDATALLERADRAMYRAKGGAEHTAWADPPPEDADPDRELQLP